jgi:hypothetical protein
MIADGGVAERLCQLQSDLGLEPLPTFIEERDAGDRSIADLGRYLHDAVKFNFRLRVQNVELLERGKTVNLLPLRQIAVTMMLYHAKNCPFGSISNVQQCRTSTDPTEWHHASSSSRPVAYI